LVIAFASLSFFAAFAQERPSLEVPVTLQSDHVLKKGEDIFLTTVFPLGIVVEGEPAKRMVAQVGSYIRCKAGARSKNSLALAGCEMLFQPVGSKENYTYAGALLGSDLSIRWRPRIFWDQLVNAGETWEAAVGSFAIGSTAALFTTRHTIVAVGTGVGFFLTSVGPFAKHHPEWFLPPKRRAIPDNRTLLFSPGKSPLRVGKLACVGENCPSPSGGAAAGLLSLPGNTARATTVP
jgi:hypothetical protein